MQHSLFTPFVTVPAASLLHAPVLLPPLIPTPTGVLVFQAADAPAPLSPASQVMEVFVSGDACIGLYALLQRQKAERPMALDILWQVGGGGRGRGVGL